MNISSKIAIGLLIVVGSTIATVPKIYGSKISQFVNDTQKTLEVKGITSKIKNNSDTYFNVEREYSVSIEDSSYILDKAGIVLGSPIRDELKKLLDETSLSFSLNLKKYPSSQENAINISLEELSPEIRKFLKSDERGIEIINFIKEKGLLVTLSLEDFLLKEAKLKDISLNIENKDKKLIHKVKNLIVTFDDLNNYVINLDEISTNIDDNINSFNFSLTSLKYKLNKIDDFNAKEDSIIKKLSISFFENKSQNKGINITLDDIKSNSNIFSKDNLVGVSGNFGIKKIGIEGPAGDVKFNDFNSKLSVNDLSKKLIENLIVSIEEGALVKKNEIDQSIKDLVHHGFQLNLDNFEIVNTKINLNNDKFELGKLSLNSAFTLNSNNIGLKERTALEWLKSISSNANIEMSKTDIMLIVSKLKIPINFLDFIKIEKEKAFINAEFKSNKLLVNSKRVY